MKVGCRVPCIVLLFALAGYFTTGHTSSQSADGPRSDAPLKHIQMLRAIRSGATGLNFWTSASPDTISCSPAPCVLPAKQVSEGGQLVNTPSIVSDPVNPRHLLLGGNNFNCGSVAGYTSQDGGSTWVGPFCLAGGIHRNGRVYYPCCFPAVGYDRNGTAYLAGIYEDNETGDTGLIGLEKSTDGVNWSQPVVVLAPRNGYAVSPWLIVDTNVDSPYVSTAYVSAYAVDGESRVTVSHSLDGGVTWTAVGAEPPQTYPADDKFTNMTIDKHGTVYLTWQHCVGTGPGASCDNGIAYMLFSKSSDGGNTWSHPALMARVTTAPNSCNCSGWGDLPNTNHIRVSNYPVIGVDNSNGPYAGNLYVVMYSWTGTYMRVGVIRSTDGGNTWSKPVPLAPPSDTHDQFFPWLSVSPTGLVGVSWLDRRNDPANVNYQPFAAISNDGGQTFKPNVLLSKAFSNPNNNGYPGNFWMGDYTGNTWAGPNFVAAWMDSSQGFVMQDVVGGIRLK